MTEEEVTHLARLARIRLTSAEVSEFQSEMSAILEYVSQVQNLTAAAAGADTGPVLRNVFRSDVVTCEPEAHTETLLSAAPYRQGRFLAVKKILQLEE